METKGVALVTGASQGIGRAIALRLADDGFDIAINDIPRGKDSLDTLSHEIAKKGRKTCILLGDVSVEADVQAMFAGLIKNLGQLDVMVANAGICIRQPIFETTVDDWDRTFSVNARGVFLCFKYAGLRMVEQGRGGRIIAASSVVGKQASALLGGYSASKFAVRGLTQSAAQEFGPHGITVNAYAPGAIETAMLEYIGDASGDRDALYKEERKIAAVGYTGKPADVASVVSYLASKEAHFITGQSISVNGGGRYFD